MIHFIARIALRTLIVVQCPDGALMSKIQEALARHASCRPDQVHVHQFITEETFKLSLSQGSVVGAILIVDELM